MSPSDLRVRMLAQAWERRETGRAIQLWSAGECLEAKAELLALAVRQERRDGDRG